jgi:pantetheine-phosphate adenylyltransferase
MKTAVYPGSFDPITYGHLDIIKRASKYFDRVIVCIMVNERKKYYLDIDERVSLVKETTKEYSNVEVDHYEGLLVDYYKEKDADVVVKGLRAISDFEYEFQMDLTNKKMNEQFETFFMMTSNEYSYLSSSLVKEILKFNGDISILVPEVVEKVLLKKEGK